MVLVPRGLPRAARPEVTALVGNGVRVLLAGLFANRDATLSEAALAEFQTYYAAHAAVETRPFPGIREALQILAQSGWGLTVCTNKPEAAARALLAELDLLRWFAAVGAGDSFPVRKPDPAHLLSTLEAAGGNADGAIMVGDHLNDVSAALGAGLPCIFAAWGYGDPAMSAGATAIAQTVAELPELCELLAPVRPANPGRAA